ncbi:MAG: potassium transporter KefA [Nitrospinae bacterium CG11_big_fil_rev_8_21_14_0_20_45_15]|nr:MAG: potassium transporter KefA [Nitrospinae bacterium CG11_big_fil_rev_8_21_14_0_20_45_15]
MDLLTQQLPTENGDFQTWFLKTEQNFANFTAEASTWLSISLFKVNETPVTTLGLFRMIIILGLAWWISGFVSQFLGRYIESKGEKDLSGVYTVSRLIHYGILGLGLFIALSSIGLDLSNLALVAGALSLGIGFGLQSIVNNFVSGLILLFERNIKIGNFIEIANGTTGVVKEINVRTTLINTNDNIDIIVPNSELVGSSVINWTLREAVRRTHIPFGVAYGSDKDLVKQAVLEAAEIVPYTYKGHKNRGPQVWLIEFGDSSLNFELIVWIKPEMVKRPAAVHAAYMWEIESALHKHNIEIPFPQRDLHLKSGFQNLFKKDMEPI